MQNFGAKCFHDKRARRGAKSHAKGRNPIRGMANPCFAFINDTEENLRGILEYCIDAGVRGIVSFGFGTTMRDGSRDYFYKKLDEFFPGMRHQYIKTYGNKYECPSPNEAKLRRIFQDTCKKNGIMYKQSDVFGYMNSLATSRQMTLYDCDGELY